MAIETPARIAILGAGPIGLEAALYARYLGYDVDLYERGAIAENVRRWGHVRMFTPFGMNRSTLGLAALKAQDDRWQPPADDAQLTGRQYAESYLLPLAHSDLLVDGLHEHTRVVSVGRVGLLKSDLHDDLARGDGDFRLLLESTKPGEHARQHFATADVVIDASGTYGCANWLGPDGLPAIGEEHARSHIEYGLPDVLGADRQHYHGRSTLLVGDGDSAAASVVALAELAGQSPDTWVTWVTRRECNEKLPQPVEPPLDNQCPERQRIAALANRLAADDANHVTYYSGTSVESVTWQPQLDRFSVRLLGKHAGEFEFDRVIANVGYRPDSSIHRELHVALAPDSEAPLGMARTVSELGSGAPLDPRALLTPEPDFYILGAKSFGRDSRFTIAHGLDQIRALFTILGDRADLDLYATMAGLY
jgi:thioredoxin reductase